MSRLLLVAFVVAAACLVLSADAVSHARRMTSSIRAAAAGRRAAASDKAGVGRTIANCCTTRAAAATWGKGGGAGSDFSLKENADIFQGHIMHLTALSGDKDSHLSCARAVPQNKPAPPNHGHHFTAMLSYDEPFQALASCAATAGCDINAAMKTAPNVCTKDDIVQRGFLVANGNCRRHYRCNDAAAGRNNDCTQCVWDNEEHCNNGPGIFAATQAMWYGGNGKPGAKCSANSFPCTGNQQKLDALQGCLVTTLGLKLGGRVASWQNTCSLILQNC